MHWFFVKLEKIHYGPFRSNYDPKNSKQNPPPSPPQKKII